MTGRPFDATMPACPIFVRAAALLLAFAALPCVAAEESVAIPKGVATHADGRAPIESLYGKYLSWSTGAGRPRSSCSRSLRERTGRCRSLRCARRQRARHLDPRGVPRRGAGGPERDRATIDDIAKLGATGRSC
jgi:hypothetical protein